MTKKKKVIECLEDLEFCYDMKTTKFTLCNTEHPSAILLLKVFKKHRYTAFSDAKDHCCNRV